MSNVHRLREPDEFGDAAPLTDIPALLERWASRIRSGECGDVVQCAIVLRATDREVTVCGFGETDSCRTFETLHLGAASLLAMLDR
jgi:hypothetical protein